MSAIHYITDDTYQTDVIIEWICKESIIVRHRMVSEMNTYVVSFLLY